MASKTRLRTFPVPKRLLFIIPVLVVFAGILIAIWLWYERKITSLDHQQQAIPVSLPTRITQ